MVVTVHRTGSCPVAKVKSADSCSLLSRIIECKLSVLNKLAYVLYSGPARIFECKQEVDLYDTRYLSVRQGCEYI